MAPCYSIAIETSCRSGGLAAGRDGEPLKVVSFDASYRHATHIISRLDELLRSLGAGPGDVAEVYVSVGPGSFTGLRLGITVARMLAQMSPGLRVAAVPTIEAVAENARGVEWQNLGVVMDSKDGEVYAGIFGRAGTEGKWHGRDARGTHGQDGHATKIQRATSCTPYIAVGEPALVRPDEFLARVPRPIVLIGEALELVKMEGEGVSLADPSLWLPSPESVWRVGRRLAEAGAFTDYRKLLPLYTRKPEAVRLWEKRNTLREFG